jgi:hypothetical protein
MIAFSFAMIVCASLNSGGWDRQVNDASGWHKVKATRIGLVGKQTASGHIIKPHDIFVALPSRCVLGSMVAVISNKQTVICKVLDVGPHSIRDPYWKNGNRPLAESGKRLPKAWGRARNKAGIDLSDGLWNELGLNKRHGIVTVKWKLLR